MKEQKNKKYLIIISGLFIFLTCLCIIFSKTSFLFKSKKNQGPEKIANFVAQYKQDSIVFYDNFDHKVTSLVVKEEDKYESFMFDYLTGEELATENIIKKNKQEEFYQKINELIYLKYPAFIADVLVNHENKVYCFEKNSLIIYFYDVVTDPQVEEELFLQVNYNEIYKYLDFTVELDENYEKDDGNKIVDTKKHIAITFDDGPSKYTASLVDILDANKAHCTFFFLGSKLLSSEDKIKKVFASEHEIGYHSYAHKNMKRQKKDDIINEYNTSNEILKGIIGQEFTLTRPPYGSINNDIKQTLDTPFILWSIDTNDWRYKDVDYLVNHVLDNVEDGSIILFHDSYETSIKAIEKLLPELYVQGYQVVTVSKLAKLKDEVLENHQTYRHF